MLQLNHDDNHDDYSYSHTLIDAVTFQINVDVWLNRHVFLFRLHAYINFYGVPYFYCWWLLGTKLPFVTLNRGSASI